jgi:hypothetical protein
MPDLGTLLSKTRKIDVGLGEGEPIHIEYRPGAITGLCIAMSDAVGAFDGTYAFLVDVLTDWDITEEGKPLPINDETLRRLPWQAVDAIKTAILEDARPNPKRAVGSGGSFSPAEK